MRSSPSHSPTPLLLPIPGHSPPSTRPRAPQQSPQQPRDNQHAQPQAPRTLGDLTQLDAELHRLARGAGRLRLRIGQALHRLGEGIHELGFSTLGAYALERCNRGGRWAAETRTLARRLQSLPRLTESLEAGAIGWSMAELLARHATPETEAALLQIARDKTVAAMRIALSSQESPGSPGSSRSTESPASPPEPQLDDDEDLTRTLSLTLPVEEAWALEATRMMVEHMDGKSTGAHFLESLLAEATISLLELIPASENNFSTEAEAEHAAWRAQMQRLQHLQAEAELQSRPAVPTDPDPGEAPDPSDLPTGIETLDTRIRHYSAELASRDLFFGRIAQRFLALRGWQALGFASEAHYARERLGISRASLRSKLSLARRTERLDHLIDALQKGRIGFEAAQLIARVATPETERAWLTRATRRTFKHLREEVQAVEMATRFLGETDGSPPSEAQLQQVEAAERAILSGELLRRVIRDPLSEPDRDGCHEPHEPARREEARAPAPDPTVQISVTPEDEAAKEPVQISVGPSAKITLRIRVPGDLLLHYRQLERLHRKHFPDESFIQFLCTTFWQTWVPQLGTSDKWEQIYRRDRYRCTNPVCHQRNVTLHHVQYRANGGTDDADNLTSPCAFCHLEGEHGGRLQILPPGNDPTWLLGRNPIIQVHRRERTLFN